MAIAMAIAMAMAMAMAIAMAMPKVLSLHLNHQFVGVGGFFQIRNSCHGREAIPNLSESVCVVVRRIAMPK